MKKKVSHLFLLILAVILLSTAGPVIKMCSEEPIKIAFYRLFFGFLFFVFFHLLDRRSKQVHAALNKTDIFVLIFSGISLGLHFFLWIKAFSFTSVAGGVIPIMIQPILVSFLSMLFFKEVLSRAMIMPLIITFSGLIIMGIGDFKTSVHLGIGDFYATLGIIMVCFYLIGVKRLIHKISPFILNIYLYIIGMCVLLVPILIEGHGFGIGTRIDFFLILWLGGACSFLGYLFINISLKRFKAPEVSFAIVGEPILSIVWAWLFLGELMSIFQTMGFALGLSGFLLFILILKKENRKKRMPM